MSDGGPGDRGGGGLGHQPGLDGLRGVAVLLVVLFHQEVSWAAGGFLGVDAFFVVSGFLITTLLVAEHERRGRVSLRDFWARRVRRLFPALALLLVAVAGYAATVAPEVTRRSLRWDGLATLGYVANWRLVWSHQSYFEAAAGPSPLRHAWSLAVEEQWYVLWPVVVVAALAVLGTQVDRRRWLSCASLACVAAAVASAAWMARLVPPGGDPSRAYYGTDTRAQGLLIGAALAFGVARWPAVGRPGRRSRPVVLGLGVAGLAAGLAVTGLVDEQADRLYRGGFLLVSVAWAAVVLASLRSVGGPVERILAVRPLTLLGRISYGVYLWNWPAVVVLTPARTHLAPRSVGLFAVRLGATLAAATVSFVLVERPVRTGRFRAAPWWRPRPVVAGVALACAFALVLTTLGAPPPPSATAGAAPGGGGGSPVLVPSRTVPSGALPPPRGAPSPPPFPGGRPLRVEAVGDSVGFSWIFDAPPVQGMELRSHAVVGCGMLPVELQVGRRRMLPSPECPTVLRSWRAAAATDPDVALVFLGAWEVFDPWVGSRRLRVGSAPWRRYVSGRVERGIEVLARSPNTRIGIMTVPCFRQDGPVAGVPSDERNQPERIAAVNDVLRRVAARHPGRAVLVDYAGFACPGGRFRDEVDGVVLRPDGLHLEVSSGRVGWAWLAPVVRELATRPSL